MAGSKFKYTGVDNLEAMQEAKRYNRALINLVVSELEGRSKYTILDFGAGSGTYADMLKAQGVIVDCVEPDKSLQRILNNKAYKAFDYADSLKPNSYDVIYALNVLEHIDDDFTVFNQLINALKPGGTVIIYVPAFNSLYSSMDKLVGHHRRYRKARLAAMAKNNHLVIKRLEYQDPLGYIAASIYKATGNRTGKISPWSVKFYDTCVFPISKAIQLTTKNLFGKNVCLIAKKSID